MATAVSAAGQASGRNSVSGALLRRVAAIHAVPPHIVVLTAGASYVAQMLAIIQGWPLWAIVLATLVPWIPLLSMEMLWTYRHYQWLALFYVLVLFQAGHFMEHVIQMVQIHLLGLAPADAHGVFGQLDTEWVHVIANTWVLVAVVLLLFRFPRNPWLWVTLVFAGWHEVEHAYIMSLHLATGAERLPGLLAKGGAIGGGVPLIRPDLHFIYNVVETAPLFVAFAYQLRHTYDEWLAKALPHLSERQLTAATDAVQTLRFGPGELVVRQGDPSDRLYIVARGHVAVSRRDEEGNDVHIATLGPGQYFGEIGLLMGTPRTATVRTRGDTELLAMDHQTFRAVVQGSQRTQEDLATLARERMNAHVS